MNETKKKYDPEAITKFEEKYLADTGTDLDSFMDEDDIDTLYSWIESSLKEAREESDKYKSALIDASLHFTQKTFSKRPCSTCQLMSELIKEPFGCVKLTQLEKE